MGRRESIPRTQDNDEQSPERMHNLVGLGGDWTPVVRSVGGFVGIAFAIVSALQLAAGPVSTWERKLPWQSTLQVSLTLALVNPVLWYLIDRSKPGFLLSTLVGLSGTALLLGINPELIPQPATSSSPSPSSSSLSSPLAGGTSSDSHFISSSWPVGNVDGALMAERIGVGTWIASVLFCSCVCFGNVGRRLAYSMNGSRPASA
ncbi:MAG: hypothetical protein M1837_006827 [Sclerophora amabilis]|nr:MAG: hypothetical protein M1837_006827 [Sclerophora amabilis]